MTGWQAAGRDGRATYASDPAATRGRRLSEDASPTRSAFQRDRDRIVHSTAFRRLMHKTQVFIAADGDHFRTRLTHSLEVAQIARSIARQLRLDEELAEAIALAHDFGHTPFGHEGEDVLDALMAEVGGFDHNAQTYRIVTRLERRYAAFDGLNLTWETLEGLVKHNGPLTDTEGRGVGRYRARPLPHAFLDDPAVRDLELATQPSLEAQIAAIADDIAYDAHDIDDGLRAGFVTFETLAEVPAIAAILSEVDALHGPLETGRRAHELVRRLLTHLIEDVIAEAHRRIAADGIETAADVRANDRPVATFSEVCATEDRAIKAFLFKTLYRSPEVLAQRKLAAGIVTDLFELFVDKPERLPRVWREGMRPGDPGQLRRRVCDYISGMTDRFAIQEHARHLEGRTPALAIDGV